MVIVIPTPNIKRVCINKINHNKTLHLVAEIESLVDTRVSMSVMVASVVKEFGIMHLVSTHETYKITSCMITKILGRIIDTPVIVGKMVFLVNIYSYDLFFRLDFFYED